MNEALSCSLFFYFIFAAALQLIYILTADCCSLLYLQASGMPVGRADVT